MFLLFNGNPSIYLLNKNKSQNRKSSCSCNFGLTFINRFRRYNHEASLRSILIKGPFKYFNVWFYNPFNYFLLITSEKGTPLIRRGLSLEGIIKGSASPPHTHTPHGWVISFPVTSFNRLLFFSHVLAFSSPLLLQAMHSKVKWIRSTFTTTELACVASVSNWVIARKRLLRRLQPNGKCKRHFIFSCLSIKSLSGIPVVLNKNTKYWLFKPIWIWIRQPRKRKSLDD